MSTPYTRSSDFVTAGSSRRSAKMNAELDKIVAAIASLLVDPTFTGAARATTLAISDDSTRLATTAFVQDVLAGTIGNLPTQSGHAGPPTEWLQTNGTSASWAPLPQQTYAILDADTATLTGVSALEIVENSLTETGLATAAQQVIFGDSLFIAAGGTGSNANVASSADGLTWVLRAMPSSAAWHIGTDGTGFVGIIDGGTGTATSSDGTTWSATSALPGACKATYCIPVFNGTTCFVLSNTASTAYTSTDYGTSWGTQTLPAVYGNMAPFVVGGLFWYWSATTAAYTSATGLTGSFTARTLPITPATAWQDFDGSLWILASSGTAYYRSTDGINWTLQTFALPFTGANKPVLTINGVRMYLSTTFGEAATMHDEAWIRRTSLVTTTSAPGTRRYAKNTGGTIFLVPYGASSAGSVGRFAPAEGGARTAVFTT